MAKAIYSISSFKMGATGAAGVMGTTLVDITQIAADSVNVTFPEATTTDFIPEEYDSAFVSLEEKGTKIVVLETLNLDVAVLPDYFGGSTATGTFTPGVTFSIGEKSFQFTTRPLGGTSQTWKFPRASVTASISGNLSKKDLLKVKLTFKVLQPINGSGVALPDFSIVQA